MTEPGHRKGVFAGFSTGFSAVFMLAALAACGGGDGSTSAAGSDGAGDSVTSPVASPAPSPPTSSAAEAPAVMPADFDSDAAMSERQSLRRDSWLSPKVAVADRCGSDNYPAQVEWPSVSASGRAQAATAGAPLIRQVRNGAVIATYSSLGVAGCEQPESNHLTPDSRCGAFSRGFGRNWEEGDVFEIYPAVYEGSDQQIWIGPSYATRADQAAGQQSIPRKLTIRGITVDGQRPIIRLPASGASENTEGQGLIHLAESEDITIENLDIAGGTSGRVGQGAIFLRGATDATLRHLRVHDFSAVKGNGIFGTDGNAGVLRIDGVELGNNGGDTGPQHNVYINPSKSDPNFTVWMTGSYTHDTQYGNTFKSRAQVNLIEGNYFQGSLSVDGLQREAYLLDLPEGGRALVRNNVLVKNASGANSNGALMSYAVEGVDDGREMSLVVEHNTFMAYARTIFGTHLIFPMFTPYQNDSGSSWTFEKVSINNNVFAGFCGTGPRDGFRGDAAWIVDFDDLDQNFALVDKSMQGNPAVIGHSSYVHATRRGVRRTAVAGALD